MDNFQEGLENIDAFVSKLRDTEHLVMARTEEVRASSQIVADGLNVAAMLSGDIPCKKQQREHLVHLSDTSKQNLEEDEDTNLKSLVLEMKTQLNQMLEDYGKETYHWTEIFSSAPTNYHVDNISCEIENLNNEVDSLEHELDEDIQPKIAEVEVKLQQEAITIMDIPGFSPSELTNKDLQKLIERFQDSLKEKERSLEENKQELKHLKTKEALYGTSG